jgi:hypothetical protein
VNIGQRLLLAVAPGIIGVIVLAGLAYWGERGRQVPELFLGVATGVTVLSLWLAWSITRDVAKRISRLGRLVDARQGRGTEHEPTLLVALSREALSRLSGTGKAGADELDAIERLVARFDGELERIAVQERAAETRVTEARAESARLLHDAGSRIAQRLDDVRLPLHVLLDAPFGALNENQEELVGAARTAADEASVEARRLLDLGALELGTGARRDRVSPADVLTATQPLLEAEARRSKVRIVADIAPALPAIVGDRARLQEALRELFTRFIRGAAADTELRITAALGTGAVEVRISPVAGIGLAELVVERRVIEALGATLALQHGVAEVRLPLWR